MGVCLRMSADPLDRTVMPKTSPTAKNLGRNDLDYLDAKVVLAADH